MNKEVEEKIKNLKVAWTIISVLGVFVAICYFLATDRWGDHPYTAQGWITLTISVSVYIIAMIFLNKRREIDTIYKNAGKNIMTFAEISACFSLVGVIVAIILFIISDEWDDYHPYTTHGWITLAISVSDFISSWFIYGFGQLVDNINAMRNK